MVSFASTAAGMTGSTVRADNWTDFYQRNRANGGPFQTLSKAGASALARRIKSNLNNVNKLTETVAGSELLTCDGTITGKGLAFILDPRSWARMSTVLNDRFKTEKDVGARFCYTLDRHLQRFLNKMTRWEDIATEGQPRYLVNKADELLERIADGQCLNVMLPVALSIAMTTTSAEGKKRIGATVAVMPDKLGTKKTKPATARGSATDDDPRAAHSNVATVDAWKLPAKTQYLDQFDAKMPGLKEWPILLSPKRHPCVSSSRH